MPKKKFIISVLGEDRPGIIAAVSRVLHDHEYNIEEVSQTILQNQFSCFFIVAGPRGASRSRLVRELERSTEGFDLFFHVHEFRTLTAPGAACECEPFVVTTRGPDRRGLVAGITAVFAAFGVNVEQLRAVFRGGDEPGDNIMIYEVSIPFRLDHEELRKALRAKAQELSLEISIQHRNIFESMNRI
jgi:glycine cleavage system transcriptional repressor